MTSDIPKSEIVSSVKPSSFIAESAIARDVGIETQTTNALRHERRKKTIAIAVSNTASISVRVTRAICCPVNLDWMLMTLNSMAGNCCSIWGSAAKTAFDASISLALEAF